MENITRRVQNQYKNLETFLRHKSRFKQMDSTQFNIIKMSVLPQANYEFNIIPIKISFEQTLLWR